MLLSNGMQEMLFRVVSTALSLSQGSLSASVAARAACRYGHCRITADRPRSSGSDPALSGFFVDPPVRCRASARPGCRSSCEYSRRTAPVPNRARNRGACVRTSERCASSGRLCFTSTQRSDACRADFRDATRIVRTCP